MSGAPETYYHTQESPLCLLVYGLAVTLLVLGWVLRDVPPILYSFPPVGLLVLILAASVHRLTVADLGDRLAIQFGPVPLFQRTICYADIVQVEVGRTTILDGWGIHLSLRGGWVWNLWGRDCVVFRFRKGVFRVGTDDAENLARFVAGRIVRQNETGYRSRG